MSISHDDAIQSLSAMFPEVPEARLRLLLGENNGHMESTVAALLGDEGRPAGYVRVTFEIR